MAVRTLLFIGFRFYGELMHHWSQECTNFQGGRTLIFCVQNVICNAAFTNIII